MKIQILEGAELKELEVERVNVIVPATYYRVRDQAVADGTMYVKLSDEGVIIDMEDETGRNIATDAFDYDWFLEILNGDK